MSKPEANLISGFTTTLKWHEGPARGGVGTAGVSDDGIPQWYDGDTLIIVIETNQGRAYGIVSLSCDEHYFRVIDASTGDEYDSWGPESWSWWAKFDTKNLPE